MGGEGDMENCFQKVNSAKSICTKNNIIEVIQVYSLFLQSLHYHCLFRSNKVHIMTLVRDTPVFERN